MLRLVFVKMDLKVFLSRLFNFRKIKEIYVKTV